MDTEMMGDEEPIDVDMETEVPAEPSPEGEMAEKMNAEDAEKFVDDVFLGLEENENVETKESKHMKKIGEMIEGMFTESKVDNVLRKYFSINENEKKQIKIKQTQILEDKKKTVNKVSVISETVSQEIMAKRLISKYPQAKLIGKTKNKNLVFEIKNKHIRVSSNGQIL
jgi:preprotein translocase subunit SecF